MDPDELFAKSPDEPLARLAREDLDRLSADELHARVSALTAEIARTEARIAAHVNQRASADRLFRQ